MAPIARFFDKRKPMKGKEERCNYFFTSFS